MRVIKLGIISLVVFTILLTLISFFFPSRVRISKAIDINAGRDSVMARLADPVRWQSWYPGADSLGPFMADGKIKGVGTGAQQALMFTGATDSTVRAANVGPHSKKGETGWNIFPGHTPRTVTLQWYMDFHLRWYPWEKFSGLLLEKRYGPMMEKGLTTLKSQIEK